MKIGYARVSTTKQDLLRQINWLENIGCEKIFTDKISGTIKGNLRKGMSQVLQTIRAGDTLFIDEMSRLGRTIPETIITMTEILDLNVEIVLNKEALTLSKFNTMGKVIATIFIAISEMENHFKKERAAHGRKIAQERGRGGGRPLGLPAETKAKAKAVKTLYNDLSHDLTVKQMCKQLSIGKTTFYRLLEYENVTLHKNR